MIAGPPSLERRVEGLERQARSGRRAVVLLALFAAAAAGAAWRAALRPTRAGRDATAEAATLRARRLVIEDDAGRDRIVLGAPVPDPKDGQRSSPSAGLVINDADGWERFAVGVLADGEVNMGFDAPPGTGDPGNRERINIVAEKDGGAYLRFLDRRTAVVGRLMVEPDNRFWLEFLDFPSGAMVRRRIGFAGEQTLRERR